MKTIDLLKFTRRALNDETKPYLWSDDDLIGWLAEAEGKAARNARLIRDFTTPTICRLSLTTSRQYYDLDPRIIFVRRVTLASRSKPLDKISFHDLDNEQPGWVDRVGTPDRWCTDFETDRLWLNKKPSAADTATLLVVRMPLCELALDKPDAEPEIKPAYHKDLHHWACYRAHSKPDSQGRDEKKASFHYAAFTGQFGEESSALDEEWERQHYGDEDGEAPL